MNIKISRKRNARSIIIRIKNDTIYVSAPTYVKSDEINDFIKRKESFILSTVKKNKEKTKLVFPDDEYILNTFSKLFNITYEQIKDKVKQKPSLKIKKVDTYFGQANYKYHQITLNKILIFMPVSAIEYVILHEFVHFLYKGHNKDFYSEVSKYMPDYKNRKKLLKDKMKEISEKYII